MPFRIRWSKFSLTWLFLERSYFQTRSRSEVLEIRTSAFEILEGTVQPVTAYVCMCVCVFSVLQRQIHRDEMERIGFRMEGRSRYRQVCPNGFRVSVIGKDWEKVTTLISKRLLVILEITILKMLREQNPYCKGLRSTNLTLSISKALLHPLKRLSFTAPLQGGHFMDEKIEAQRITVLLCQSTSEVNFGLSCNSSNAVLLCFYLILGSPM